MAKSLIFADSEKKSTFHTRNRILNLTAYSMATGKENNNVFAPQLITSNGAAAIDFYTKAFGAIELHRWNNDDGTVHVAEISLGTTLFHIREESVKQGNLSPETAGGITVIIGLFVDDPGAVAARAVEAGATLTNPVQDYEFGYRQASITDPFGHHWLLEKKI